MSESDGIIGTNQDHVFCYPDPMTGRHVHIGNGDWTSSGHHGAFRGPRPRYDHRRDLPPSGRTRVTPVYTPPLPTLVPTPEEDTAVLEKAIEEAIDDFRRGIEEYLEFLSYLRAAQLALSQDPDPPMTLDSGHYRPRKRKQITYLVTPEKAIVRSARTVTHQRRTIADMIAEMELDLLDLAPYTAAYKLLPEGGGAPVKGVLKTFGLDHFFKEYEFWYGLRRKIIEATHKKYCMPRDEIEKELRQQRTAQQEETEPKRQEKAQDNHASVSVQPVHEAKARPRQQEKAQNNQAAPLKQKGQVAVTEPPQRQMSDPKPDDTETPRRRGRK